MLKALKRILFASLVAVIPTLILWLPFFFRVERVWNIPLPQSGMQSIVANYDGPLFLVVAKSFYDPATISENFEFTLPTEYYAAHFPALPALIKLLSPLLGFPYSMLFVTLASSALAIYFFNLFIRQYVEGKNATFLTIFFGLFPARWLIVRSVGSAEPLFMAAVIASVYYFQNKKYLWAGLWGVVAQLTKSPGVLLFVAYALAFFGPRLKNLATSSFRNWLKETQATKFLPILLIPVSLLGIFAFFQLRMGDFLAYFHSGDNIHLLFPPFQIFNYSAPWVGTFWLEEIIFVYLIGALGVATLAKRDKDIVYYFSLVFFVSLLFVSHRDVIRYSLPLAPFMMAAFPETLIKKEFKIAFTVIVIPIFLYSLAFISQNVMQISNWSSFL
jgi:hypothetical protein